MSALQKPTSSVATPLPAYKRILIGYDGSKNSERALVRAATIAKEHRASLTVVAVVNTNMSVAVPFAPAVTQEVFDELIQGGKDTIAAALKVVAPIDSGATGSVEQGNPALCILSVAASKEIDLIVLGRRGMSSVERFFIGGVSSNVVSHSKCDVLIVK